MSKKPSTPCCVVSFPTRSHQKTKRTGEIAAHIFPFTPQECAIIDMHLCERSPEICLDIHDLRVREIVERFMVYIWEKQTRNARASLKSV